MVLIVPRDSYGIKSIMIGKGVYTDGFKEGKVGFFLIYEDNILKRAFFKFMGKHNWVAIDLEKWNENGGTIINNNREKAMILLNNGKGELHLHGKDSSEYKFTYKIIERDL